MRANSKNERENKGSRSQGPGRDCSKFKVKEEFYVEFEVDRYRGLYFTSAVGEYRPLYIDEHLAKALDMPSSPVPTSYLSSLLMSYLMEWGGTSYCIKELHMQIKGDVFPGDVIKIKGMVVQKRGRRTKILIEVMKGDEFVTSQCWAVLEFSGKRG